MQPSDSLQLHCLGTVGYHPNRSRQTSCYFLPEAGIVLDAGSGIFRLPELIVTETLDILLSHAHLDHTVGLTYLLDVFQQRPVERLRIWGEAAKLAAVQEHLFSELLFPAQPAAEWVPIDQQSEFAIGALRISWRKQPHPGGSVAYRLDWPSGSRLVYATDTSGDTSEGFAQWCRGTSLLLHECYFRDEAAAWAERTGHSWTSRVAEIAGAVKPAKLLLTHINPLATEDDPMELDAIAAAAGCDVLWAEDELVVTF